MGSETVFGYTFQNPEILKEALTHPGVAMQRGNRPFNYERLEFLGDRVLSLVVTDLLMDCFPADTEGDLSQRHAALVCRQTVAEVARAVGLDQQIVLSSADEGSEYRTNPALLCDVCESVLGGIYRDGGFPAAYEVIRRLWAPRLDSGKTPPQSPKTRLQEKAQANGGELPVYEVVETRGPDHNPVFCVAVHLGGGEPVQAQGHSKREAEQKAAEKMLEELDL